MFYDEGWNDRMKDIPIDFRKSIDYIDGWKDADQYLADGNPREEFPSVDAPVC